MLADLCLVLLLDASGSVDAAEWELQAKATADALSTPAIVEKITHGAYGAVAVTAMEWSGAALMAVPWTRIASMGEAKSFALQLASYQRRQSGSTAMGDALLAAGALLEAVPANVATGCLRQVVDISGDGTSNAGALPADAIAVLQARDTVVNGIVIEDEIGVVEYYEGLIPGFVLRATRDSYREAIQAKLQLEIAAYPMVERHAAGPVILLPGAYGYRYGGAWGRSPMLVDQRIGTAWPGQGEPDSVPAPGSLALLALGIVGLAVARWQR